MNATTAVTNILMQQNAFKTLTALMLIDYLFPKSAKLKDSDEFDFLIVGGGTAGCVIANRLIKANFNVLVLEAGDNKPFEAFLPGTLAYLPRTRLDWNYTAVPDPFSGNCHQSSSVELPSGKVLGGSSSINFMVTSRGNYRDYHRWAAAAKDSAWELKNLIHLFIRNERLLAPEIAKSPLARCRGFEGNPPDSGDGGPGKIGIAVDNSTNIDNYLRSFEEMGNELVLDLNGKHSTGYTRGLLSVAEGFRQSTAYGYLVPAAIQDSKTNPKLFVSKNTLVTKIVFDEDKNAIGVMAAINNSAPIFLKAKKEVIVTAGALKSPQLLMLSGIGRRKHLEDKNIEVLSDLPVGENFQDHVGVSVLHTTRKRTPPTTTNLQEFPASVVVGFKSLNLCGQYPDYGTITYSARTPEVLIQICLQFFNFKKETCDALNKENLEREVAHTQIFGVHPKSRGKVLLNTINPYDAPIIETGYYTKKEDIENTIKYLKDFMPIENTTFFRNSGGRRIDPDNCCANTGTDDYWRCYIYCLSNSMWNYCGSCSMGAVVDSKLKVFGVHKLRVADASVIPKLISGGNYLPTIVVAEKASDLIKEEWQ